MQVSVWLMISVSHKVQAQKIKGTSCSVDTTVADHFLDFSVIEEKLK